MSRFLRFCAFLSVLFFTGNLMAAGYTCSTTATYTSCKEGYYLEACGTEESDWSGQTATPVTGKTCLTCPDGYTCSGGQKCPLRTGIHCTAGTYIKAGDTKCTSCPAGKYCSGFDTDDEAATETDRGITGTCPAGKYCPTGTGTPKSCPAYYGTSAAGSDAESDCYTSCGVGAAVFVPKTACATPAGAWYSAMAHVVYYGSISPIAYCPLGSDSRNGVTSLHDQGADCLVTVPAGYSSAVTTSTARYIRISSETGVFPLTEIQAYNSATQLSLALGSSVTNGANALDGSLMTQAGVTTGSGVGAYAIFDLGSAKTITNIKFALGNVTSGYNIVIAISSDKSNWTTVFNQTVYGVSALPGVMQNVPLNTRTNTKCAPGTYHDKTTVPATNGVTCTACPTAICNGETNCASGFSTHRNTYPANYHSDDNLKLVKAWFSTSSNTGNTSIEECKLSYTYTNNRGTFNQDSVRYQSSTGRYDGVGGVVYYTVLNPGYYGSGKLSDTYCDTDTNNRRHYYQDALLCPAGKYCSGYTQMPLCSSGTYNDTLGIDGSVSVGYYSTGGGTSATPTAAGNGCLSGQGCGPLAAGYFSVQPGMTTPTPTYMGQKCDLVTIDGVAGSMGCGTVAAGYYSTGGGTHPRPTASGNGCIAGQECGTVAAGYYSTGGAKSETGAGAVYAGSYSTGGATSPRPESNADCVGGNSCGLLSGGYFSTGGATKAAPTSADCVGAIGSDIWSSSDSPVKNVCGQVLGGYYSTEGGILPAPGELGTKNTTALGFSIDYLNQGLDSVRAGCLGGSSKCGMIRAGHFASGGATSSAPSSADCVSGTCGVCPVGAYSAAGATSCTSCPALGGSNWAWNMARGAESYSACKRTGVPDGCSAGTVTDTATSETTWGNRVLTEWAAPGNTQLLAKAGYQIDVTNLKCMICPNGYYALGNVDSCAPVDAGYYATGAATSPAPSSTDCVTGTCGLIDAGYWGAAGATTSTGSGKVAAGYYNLGGGTSATPEVRGKGCANVSTTQCGTVAPGYWGTAGATQYGGSGAVAPGYYSTGGATSRTPSASDCAGKVAIIENGKLMGASDVNNTCGQVQAGYWNNACGINATGGVCSTSYQGGIIAAGYWGTVGATDSVGSGRIAPGYYSTGGATIEYPDPNQCVGNNTCGAIAAGYWNNGGGTLAAPTAPGNGCHSDKSCGLINAGYYSTGGGTSATPTAASNGCLANKSCGTVNGGYYSTGGGTSATPTAAGNGCLSGKQCGVVDAGYYATGGATSAQGHGIIKLGLYSTCGATSEGGSNLAASDYLECADGCECGRVAAGYFANGGGTSATPTAAGNGCLSGQSCGTMAAGYYSRGGAGSSNASGQYCWGYNKYSDGVNGCGKLSAEYYSNGGSTDNGATCVSGKTCGTCNANYRANTTTGKTSASQCQASCAAGTRVATVNAACTSPAGGWFSAAHLVNYGQISPVNYCMSGYTSASTSASGHDAKSDCVQTIAGGKYVPSSKINARYIKITSDGSVSVSGSTNPSTHLLEMQAFASNDGTGTNLLSGKGAVAGDKMSAVTNGNWTRGDGYSYGEGSPMILDLGSVQALGSLKFAMYTDGREYQNVVIAVSEDNTTYTTVFTANKLLTQNTTTPTGELVVLSAVPKSCALGTYKASGSLALTNTSSCDAAQAGYFVGTTGASSQTKCVMGSYTDTTGQSACKACAGGKTNSADGATSCTAPCSNATGVASTGWETPVWGTDNKMTNLCTIKATAGCSAKYYKDSNACLMCPDGYQDGGAGYTQISQCTMNVEGGKYVAVAKESSASGTCEQGYAKEAHPVTYGETSTCDPCKGATYAAQEGMDKCEPCPTVSGASGYGYWNTSSEAGNHKVRAGCQASFKNASIDDGNLTMYSCYVDASADTYGVKGDGKGCWVNRSHLTCNGGYYNKKFNDSTSATQDLTYKTSSDLLENVCRDVESGYWSGADSLTRTACATGLVTCGAGLCANEAGDCGRKLHAGDNVIYLRSQKRTTPSLNVKIGDKMFYGNLGDVVANSLRVKNGTKNYSVVNDNQ